MLNHFRKPQLFRNNLLVIITMLFTLSCAQTKENNHQTLKEIDVLPEYVFSPAADLSTQVNQTLALARSQHKKALLVLGAQWCHDSRGLAKNFSTPQMQQILNEHYQVLFIDVGYLEKGFDIVKQFNLPIYYGTPTVMVIDPNASQVINIANMKKWLSADKVPLTEYVEDFTQIASKSIAEDELNPKMLRYLNQINAFEQQQANRLTAAYGMVGPLLKQYMNSDKKEASAEFTNKWEQVYALRSRVQGDVQTLIAQARENVSTGSLAKLTFPTYPAFTWE